MMSTPDTDEFILSTCPSCASKAIQRVCQDWVGIVQGKSYEVKDLEYYRCPDCLENVYTPQAMRRIQQASPAYTRSTRQVVQTSSATVEATADATSSK